MADALMGVTETSAAAHAAVSKLAQEYLVQQSVLLPTVTDYSALAVKGASSIKVPRAGGFTVNSKAENTSQDAQTITFASDTISLDQHRVVQFLLEDIADIQSNVSVVQEAVLRASKDLALDMDNKIIAELRLASSSAPDHEIVFNDTSNNDLELVDVLEVRRLLLTQNLNPKECYIGIGPDKEKDMLAISDFIDASKYGSSEPVMMGEIGRVFGMRVIVHTSLADEMVAWHPSAVGIAMQQDVRFQTDLDLGNLARRYSLDYIGGFEVLDGGKRNVHVVHT